MKWMKLVFIFLLFLAPSIVCADLYVQEGFFSDGDINANVGFFAGGDVNLNLNGTKSGTNLYIDGWDYGTVNNQSVTVIHQTSIERKASGAKYETVLKKMANLFMKYERAAKSWRFVDPTELDPEEFTFRQVFDAYFIPRTEHNQIVNTLQNQIKYLNFEMMAMQRVIGEDKICSEKIKLAKEYDLPVVECGNTTYYNTDDDEKDIVGLTVVPQPPPLDFHFVW